MTPSDDHFATVLAAARDGNQRAWRMLFDEYAPAVAGYLRVQGVTDVDDLVGEVFYGVFRGIGRFAGDEARFRSWVFVIAHHRIVDERRRRSRADVRPVADPPEVGRHGASGVESGDGADVAALDALGHDRVVALCGQLVPDQRDVLLLRLVGDLTVEQVAAVLDKSPGAVKALQRRGLAALRKVLSREGVPL